MGNCISTISDHRLNRVFQWIEEKGGYNHHLEKNLDSLEVSMVDLMAKQDSLLRRLKSEEDTGLQRLPEFQVWLDRVETTEQKVNALLSDRDVEIQKLYVCGFCYGYGEKVVLTLKEVEELKSEDFEVIADQAQTSKVQDRPLQRIVVGQEKMFEKAWKHLIEDGVGIMGMYGVGGVGKTTLLTQMKHKLSYNYGFDFVIWVLVSNELQLEKIQDEIAHKAYLDQHDYGPAGKEWNKKDKSEKGLHIFNFLSKKKFILFLDDIWEKVDLAEIGVPDPRTQKGCKVAFTTRSQAVCSCMEVEDPMEVQCMAENEAFDLFQKKVGETTLGSDLGIPYLARTIAKKCCGLPLAINVISETMSCKRTIQEWRHAIHVLSLYAAEFAGMEDKILPLLKYSYDSLKGEEVKSCLLYCALFPEEAKIPKECLIEYWICEGIIDGSEGIEMAEIKGYDIIGSLIRASLLMKDFDHDGKGYVRMHDVVREMALWIASDLGRQKEAFIVLADVGLHAMPNVKNWKAVRRMSLMNNKIHHLYGSHKCLELTTLLLQRANLSNISSEFFKSMPKLAALDLSFNRNLSELPEEISNLVSLKYLNLSHTGTLELSKGIQELKKLIHLNLEVTRKLKSIAGISSLHNLKVLKLYDSRFSWDVDTLVELEALEQLEIITITINSQSPAKEQYLRSRRLMICTQSLEIRNLESSGISLPETMDKLREFSIQQYCRISEIKMGRICSFLSLVQVHIHDCEGLRELTFLMFAPNLTALHVSGVKDLKDIINKEKVCEVENPEIILPFQKLTNLYLKGLYKLKNIYWSPLPFPCLNSITIRDCPNLKKLPLDSKSGNLRKPGSSGNGFFIEYDPRDWIKGVEWEDEATKIRILPFCYEDYRYTY